MIPEKNTDLGENRYKIAVKIPITVPVGESSIVVSRKQKKRFGLGVGDYSIVELPSEENIRLAPTCVELALVTERTGDKINVINLKDPLSNEQTPNRNLYAVNIDPADQPKTGSPNTRLWHQQIGVIPTASETEGIAGTSDPKKMVFTNGFASVRTISNGEEIKLQDDGKGFGVLEIESDDPLNFSAAVRYAPLSLGATTDYFDVNEAVAVTVTQDGKYAFVAGRNSRATVNTREGGNIGIIANPLDSNP